MPRFVILEHDHPFLHWDLMLEAGQSLRTWRLSEPPERGRSVPAEPLPDHRRMYLDYEGPVSHNRGRVVRWDDGTFTWQADEGDVVSVRVAGERVQGLLVLKPRPGTGWEAALE